MRISNPASFSVVVVIAFVVGLISILPGCSGTSSLVERNPSSEQNRSGSTVPISLSSRSFISLTVQTGDQKSQFLLYPSLANTVIFQGEQKGFSTDQPFIQQQSGSRREVQINPVQIGSMSVGPVPALLTKRKRVRKLSTVLANENLDQVEGVLGYDFLQDKQLTVDYPSRKLRLKRAMPSTTSSLMETLNPGKTDFELVETAKSKRMISFEAGVNGEYKTNVAVDLGIPVNLLHGATREKWNLEPLSKKQLERRFGTVSEKFTFVSFNRFWIGGRVFKKVLVRERQGMKSQLGVDSDIILGNYFFSDKVVQINFPQRWIGIQSVDEQTEE